MWPPVRDAVEGVVAAIRHLLDVSVDEVGEDGSALLQEGLRVLLEGPPPQGLCVGASATRREAFLHCAPCLLHVFHLPRALSGHSELLRNLLVEDALR